MLLTKKELVERWQTETGRAEQSQVIRCLQKGRDLSTLPFLRRYAGRWDLRGISLRVEGRVHEIPILIPLAEGYVFETTWILGPRLKFKKRRFQDLDLCYADLGGAIFERCHFENVLFREANCAGWDDKRSTFKGVDFYKADLRGATLGLDGARYERVSFQQADLRDVHCYRGYLVNCDFSEARLDELDFKVSHFIDCKFKGRLREVWFRGYWPNRAQEKSYGKTEPNPMKNVDFSRAELWGTMFSDGCDLSTLILPRDGKHHLFRCWPQVLAKTKAQIEEAWDGDFRKEGLVWVNSHEYETHTARKQPMYVLNEQYIAVHHAPYVGAIEAGQRFAKALIRLLKEAEKQVC